MDHAPRAASPDDTDRNRTDSDIPVADSATLMKGRRELTIRHGTQTYRLRMTASDKLILTK
jgi:hemin uptake protein HemP